MPLVKDEALVSVKNLFLSEQNKGFEKEIVEILLKENISVTCANRDKKRLMPFNSLYGKGNRFWLQEHTWDYFISDEDRKNIEELIGIKPVNFDAPQKKDAPSKQEALSKQEAPPKQEAPGKPRELSDAEILLHLSEGTPDLDYHVNLLGQLTLKKTDVSDNSNNTNNSNSSNNSFKTSEEPVVIDYHVRLLNDLIAKKTRDPEIVSGVLVDAVRDTVIINRDVIMSAMNYSNTEAKNLTQNLVKSTIEMVRVASSFKMEKIFHGELINTLIQRCNGSVVKHMIRTYLQGIAFFEFYNNLMSSSYAVSKLRIEFNKNYLPFYAMLLPHLDQSQITLERVFFKGMRAIPPAYFYNWALGLLIHDIGKDFSVEYNEGEQNYYRPKAAEHVKLGISAITNKTNYSREAAIITGYHHDYYGSIDGYGVYRSYMENFRKNNPGKQQDFCIGFDLENLLKCEVLAYFPAKILEIIDIYDSLTDVSRVSSKVLNHNEAINVMWNEHVINRRMLDPILFNLFVTFKSVK